MRLKEKIYSILLLVTICLSLSTYSSEITIESKLCDMKCQYNKLDRRVVIMIEYVRGWYHGKGLHFRLTSIYRVCIDGISISRTHCTYRAADFSVNGLTLTDLEDLQTAVMRRFLEWGAIRRSSGLRAPLVIHDAGRGLHGHLQVDREKR